METKMQEAWKRILSFLSFQIVLKIHEPLFVMKAGVWI